MKAKTAFLVVMLIIILVAAVFVGSRVWTRLTSPASSTTYSEIREYNGTKLDSINDFEPEAIEGTQQINITTYRLVVTGLVNFEKNYTYDEVVNNHAHYEKVVTLHCVDGWQVTVLWEGIRLKDLLDEAVYDPNAQVVIFYAQDGYTTSLPLSYIINNNIMIAYKVNGVVLPASEGYPFQLVAEGKLGYKWIKWITKIEVSNDTSFRGYWESRGYSNGANYP